MNRKSFEKKNPFSVVETHNSDSQKLIMTYINRNIYDLPIVLLFFLNFCMYKNVLRVSPENE